MTASEKEDNQDDEYERDPMCTPTVQDAMLKEMKRQSEALENIVHIMDSMFRAQGGSYI